MEESNEKKSSHFDDKKFRKSMHLPGIFVADKGNDSDHSPLPASKEVHNQLLFNLHNYFLIFIVLDIY